MGDPWLDEKVTLEGFVATKDKTVTGLLKTRREWLEIFAAYADSAGIIHQLLDTSGQITEKNSAALLTNTGIGTGPKALDPYQSTGLAVRTVLASGTMQSLTKAYTASGVDGSVAATELLPAGGAGLKWVIWDLTISARTTLTATSGIRAALSDMASNRMSAIEGPPSGYQPHPGPCVQTTSNTAINLSVAAGGTGNGAVIFVTFRCALVPG